MKKTSKSPPEVRERAVRMVQEHSGEYPSLRVVIESIAPKIGCVPQTLHESIRKHGSTAVRTPAQAAKSMNTQGAGARSL